MPATAYVISTALMRTAASDRCRNVPQRLVPVASRGPTHADWHRAVVGQRVSEDSIVSCTRYGGRRTWTRWTTPRR